MTEVIHAPGRPYQVRGHRLWIEAEGDGPPLLVLAGSATSSRTGHDARSHAWPVT